MSAELNLKNVTVEFPSYKLSTRKKIVTSIFGNTREVEKFKVLDNINLKLSSGDRVGLVGQNGAGKTTLLRIMSGILPPSSGNVEVLGKVLPLIQAKANIIPPLTCIENVTLHGLRNKMRGHELSEFIETVREVSSLEKFMNFPVNKLSAGMRSRLLISMLHANPADIIIMDEWIGTTDQKVLKHGEGLLSKLIESSKIFVLASHRIAILHQYCNILVKLNNGKVESIKRITPNEE